MSETQLADGIVSDPEVCGGRPRIAGTRVRVIDILEALAAGDTADEIVASLPYVSHADIRAALAYAATTLDREDFAA
jgi:uncharacterized protein (DUF433 family)